MFGSREKKLLRRALALYAGEHVLEHVLTGGEAFLSPQARAVELTMLFFDVASFTNPPDGLTASALGQWATAYAEAMTMAVRRTAGTFDNFVGDSGSAWWGVGGELDHADHALACARELLSATERLNQQSSITHKLAIRLKIGIHTGLVSLGNFGSSSRLRYTVMGDAVNLAANLCGIAPTYSKHVILSGATHSRLKSTSSTTLIDSVRVKGQDEPVPIYSAAF